MFAENILQDDVTEVADFNDCPQVLLNAHKRSWSLPVACASMASRAVLVFGINQVAIEIYTNMSSISASVVLVKSEKVKTFAS